MQTKFFRYALSLILAALFFGALVFQTEAVWPFSHWPMYSNLVRLQGVAGHRLILESVSGKKTYWMPHFGYSSMYFDLSCKHAMRAPSLKDKERTLKDAVLRALIEIKATSSTEGITSLHIEQSSIDQMEPVFTFRKAIIFSRSIHELISI